MDNDDLSEELAELVTNALEEKGMTLKELAKQLGVTYEHSRRLGKGFPPSKVLLKPLCALLGLNYDTTEKVVLEASAVRKFGPGILEAKGIDPDMEPVQRAWKQLKPAQKEDVLALMRSMVKRNKGGGK